MTDLAKLLRASDPAANLSPTAEPVLEQRIEQILALPQTDAPLVETAGPPRRRPGWLLGLGLIGALVLVISALNAPPSRQYLAQNPGDRARQLLHAAALNELEPAPGANDYWHYRGQSIESASMDVYPPVSYLMAVDRTNYFPADPTQPSCFQITTEVVEVLSGSMPMTGPEPPTINCVPADLVRTQLPTVPSDPAQLHDYFYQDATGEDGVDADRAFHRAAGLLASGFLPAPQRAAVFEFLAGLHGLEVIDPETTVGERTGISIGRPDYHSDDQSLLIFDPDSGELIGARSGTDHVTIIDRSVGALPQSVIDEACRVANGVQTVCPTR